MTSATLVNVSGDNSTPDGVTKLGSALALPRQLRIRQLLCVVLAVLVALLGLHAYQRYAYVVQTIGKDSVPSIVAAEKIRTTLADAHTQIVNVFLTGEGANGQNAQAYAKSISEAHNYLLIAAQNITYGEEERAPILSVMTQLSAYERLVGMALASKDHDEVLLKADSLMREHILPAVVALDTANFKHLASAYTEGESQAKSSLLIFLILAGLLVLLMLETQQKLYGNFKRLINPALAAGTIIFIVCVLFFAVKAGRIVDDIRSAKEDAFDSVHALSQAEALAYTANAQESVYLLLQKKDEQHHQTVLFQQAAMALFSANLPDGKTLPANLKTLKGQGLLGDELANITFAGEEKSARETLSRWLTYLQIDTQIRSLENAGKHAEALALCLGEQINQSDWAFDRFIKSLDETTGINQVQFDTAVEHAMKSVSWLWLLLLPVLLAPLLGALVGVQQRLAEFRE